MVELVDTHGSGSCVLTDVGVRVSPTAPFLLQELAKNSGKSPADFPSNGQIAQLVEQRTENPCVGGSIPPLATAI